jgi:hypothetical protein
MSTCRRTRVLALGGRHWPRIAGQAALDRASALRIAFREAVDYAAENALQVSRGALN